MIIEKLGIPVVVLPPLRTMVATSLEVEYEFHLRLLPTLTVSFAYTYRRGVCTDLVVEYLTLCCEAPLQGHLKFRCENCRKPVPLLREQKKLHINPQLRRYPNYFADTLEERLEELADAWISLHDPLLSIIEKTPVVELLEEFAQKSVEAELVMLSEQEWLSTREKPGDVS